MTFESLGLSPFLINTATRHGFSTPTPVQAAAIPAILRGGDVWASARTGSGKTAAFVLPILEMLRAKPRQGRAVRALVLLPTRELALQVAKVFEDFARPLPERIVTCVGIGGVSINPQMMALRGGADVVVGTPGRLLELVEKNALELGGLSVLVLDEADRMLSLGFADEIDAVFKLLPSDRQNLLFSATFPPTVQTLAQNLLRDPTEINLDRGGVVDGALVLHRALEVDVDQRTMLLRQLLSTEGWGQTLVFVATRHRADHLSNKLERMGFRSAALHGDLSQGARTEALLAFKHKVVDVLVATDVAARGIDIVSLAAVINYDLPRSTADYLHRIGVQVGLEKQALPSALSMRSVTRIFALSKNATA